jgi:hypothetical protein
VAEDIDTLAAELTKARDDGMERGWLVVLTAALITVIAVVVVVSIYIFFQLF